MKFKAMKAKILDYLDRRDVSHQQPGDMDIKNQLAVGQISLGDVAQIIRHARGDSYSSSPHHIIAGIDVHVVKTRYASQDRHIKMVFCRSWQCIY